MSLSFEKEIFPQDIDFLYLMMTNLRFLIRQICINKEELEGCRHRNCSAADFVIFIRDDQISACYLFDSDYSALNSTNSTWKRRTDILANNLWGLSDVTNTTTTTRTDAELKVLYTSKCFEGNPKRRLLCTPTFVFTHERTNIY